MSFTFFRPRKDGPEIVIEDAVVSNYPVVFAENDLPRWAAGSVPIGAGIPDIVIVTCKPQVFALAQLDMPNAHILAYLRGVNKAKLDTISERIGKPQEVIVRSLNGLIDIDVVSNETNYYSLVPRWREILPDIVTIEVKVTNWRKAIDQAVRNRIFAHRSFIALPERLAHRVYTDEIFKQFGIGVLSVTDDNQVSIVRRARRHQPRVWAYYYHLASFVATNSDGVLPCPITSQLSKQRLHTQSIPL